MEEKKTPSSMTDNEINDKFRSLEKMSQNYDEFHSENCSYRNEYKRYQDDLKKYGQEQKWIEHDLACYAKRYNWGNWCGYVGVTKEHKLYGIGEDEVGGLPSHKGITAAFPMKIFVQEKHDDDYWVFGFDCAHYGDWVLREFDNTPMPPPFVVSLVPPSQIVLPETIAGPLPREGEDIKTGRYWDFRYVKTILSRMAHALAYGKAYNIKTEQQPKKRKSRKQQLNKMAKRKLKRQKNKYMLHVDPSCDRVELLQQLCNLWIPKKGFTINSLLCSTSKDVLKIILSINAGFVSGVGNVVINTNLKSNPIDLSNYFENNGRDRRKTMKLLQDCKGLQGVAPL